MENLSRKRGVCERCGEETMGSRFCLRCWKEMAGGDSSWTRIYKRR